jgi:putative endonuclease
MVMQKSGYTYILTNKNMTVLYCGVTSNLEKRLWEHKNKIHGGFTAKYNIDRLVYFEMHNDIEFAISREKIIKKKSRSGKIRLIESMNPDWNELLPN